MSDVFNNMVMILQTIHQSESPNRHRLDALWAGPSWQIQLHCYKLYQYRHPEIRQRAHPVLRNYT